MTDKAKLIIKKEMVERTGVLNLNNCGLTEWPEEIFEMTWLRELEVSHSFETRYKYEEPIWPDILRNDEVINWDQNKLNSIHPKIVRLKNLEVLDLSFNQISKIEHIENFRNLKTLDIRSNQLTKIENLNTFNNYLEKLQYVDISYNPFTEEHWITPEWLNDNGSNIDKIKERLTEYLQSQNKFNTKYKPPTKIILLGNSGAGKSTLSLALINKKIPTKEEREATTHGLKIRQWPEENAIIYDFGGQDYYHAVYNLFFTDQTQYIVIWNDRNNSNGLNNAINDSFHHFDHRYWMGNVNYYLNDKEEVSRIALINCFEGQKNYFLLEQDADLYNTDHFHAITFPESGDQAKANLQLQLARYSIVEELKKVVKKGGYHKLEVQLMQEVSNKLDEHKQNAEPMTRATFFEKFKVNQKELADSSVDENILLSLLHHRGLIYRHKGITESEDKIWVNPEGLNYAIHQKISEDEMKDCKGRMKVDKATELFGIDLLNVMADTQLIFLHAYPNDNSLVEYIIPQYLPLYDDSPLYAIASHNIDQGFTLKFYDFIPHGLMSRLICRFGLEPDKKHFFRYEMLFTLSEQKAKVRVKIDMVKMTAEVFVLLDKKIERQRASYYEYLFKAIVSAYNNDKAHYTYSDFLSHKTNIKEAEDSETMTIWKSIEYKLPHNLYLSTDNVHFVKYDDLKDMKEKDTYVTATLFNFVEKNEQDQVINKWHDKGTTSILRYSFNPFVKVDAPEPKKLFISYSSKDSAFMQRFITHLKPLEREGLLKPWVDRMIEPGKEWNEEIQKALEESDVIVYLLSPDFIGTPYIMDVEVKKGFEFFENAKNAGNAVKIFFIQLLPCNWKRSFSQHQQILDKNEIGKELVLIERSDNDKEWVKIIELIENTILK